MICGEKKFVSLDLTWRDKEAETNWTVEEEKKAHHDVWDTKLASDLRPEWRSFKKK